MPKVNKITRDTYKEWMPGEVQGYNPREKALREGKRKPMPRNPGLADAIRKGAGIPAMGIQRAMGLGAVSDTEAKGIRGARAAGKWVKDQFKKYQSNK